MKKEGGHAMALVKNHWLLTWTFGFDPRPVPRVLPLPPGVSTATACFHCHRVLTQLQLTNISIICGGESGTGTIYFGFPLSFHQCSRLIHSSVNKAVILAVDSVIK